MTEFRVDMSDGRHKYDHPNGNTWQEYEIVNGKPQGKWIHYHSNGQVSIEQEYDKGLKVGCWKIWHDNGVCPDRNTRHRGWWLSKRLAH